MPAVPGAFDAVSVISVNVVEDEVDTGLVKETELAKEAGGAKEDWGEKVAKKLRELEAREARLYGREQMLSAREEIFAIRQSNLAHKEVELVEKERREKERKEQEESQIIQELRKYGDGSNNANDAMFNGIRKSVASLHLFGEADAASRKDSTGSSTLYPPSEASLEKKSQSSRNQSFDRSSSRINRMRSSHAIAESRSMHNVDPDDGVEYPSATKLAFITTALCLSVFCLALDGTIIATAIPRITDQFKSIADIGWYGSAYLLTQCAFGLLFGKLFTFYSVKWLYLGVLATFELGSAICGAAPNSSTLIVGRAIAGIGAAGLYNGGMLIVASSVPLKKRPMYVGLIGGIYGIASVLGPLLGGAFTDSSATWRWCFYINLPIGGITGAFIFFFYQPTKDQQFAAAGASFKEKLDQIDVFGTATFLPFVVCILLALQWGGTKYDWGSWRIILCFVFGGILLVLFCGIQVWKGENATVPLRLLKQRTIASGSFFIFCLGGAFVLFTYYIPIWFQAIQDSSPVNAGLKAIPMLMALVVATMIAGICTSTWGFYFPFFYLASVFTPIGAGLISLWDVDTTSSEWIGYQIVLGIGVGFGIQQMLVAVQVVLPQRDVPTGTALVLFFQNFGGALFLSVGQNIFTNDLNKNIGRIPGISNVEALVEAGATAFRDLVGPDLLPAVTVAYAKAMQSTFYVGVSMASMTILGAIFIEWKSVKVVKKD